MSCLVIVAFIFMGSIWSCFGYSKSCDAYPNKIILSINCSHTEPDCWNYFSNNMKFQNNSCILLETNVVLNETIRIESIQNILVTADDFHSIQCKEGFHGLFFGYATDISISNISFTNCGHSFEPNAYTTLFFKRITNLTIDSVTFTNSVSSSVVFVDIAGLLHMKKVSIVNDYKLFPQSVSNASATRIEYTDEFMLHNAKILIESCVWSNLSNQSNSTKFGEGGALNIQLNGCTSNNNINISFCNFENNTAEYGGAVFISLSPYARNNIIAFWKSNFTSNHAGISGGAVYIIETKNDAEMTENHLIFSHVHFSRNYAIQGGGLTYSFVADTSNPNYQVIDVDLNSIGMMILENSHLVRNVAHLASAVYVQNCKMVFRNSRFLLNTILLREKQDKYLSNGAIYAFNSRLQFEERNLFDNNNNTAVILDSVKMVVVGSLHFMNNFGYNGGALALYGHSQIILYEHSTLNFTENYAVHKGYSIFVEIPGPPVENLKSTELKLFDCFFACHKTNSSKTSCEDFDGKVAFHIEPLSGIRNAIYASSLQNCLQPKDKNNLQNVFTTWKNFVLPNDSLSVMTEPIKLHVQDWKDSFPGDIYSLFVDMIDERGNNVNGTVRIDTTNNVTIRNPSFGVTNGKHISVNFFGGQINNKFDVNFTSDEYKPLHAIKRNRNLTSCPFGLKHQSSSCICDIRNNMKRGIAVCNIYEVYLYPNRWISNGLESFSCPLGYCHNCAETSDIHCLYNKSRQCRQYRLQSSRLCGQCEGNLSVVMGSEKCHDCRNEEHWVAVTSLIIVGLSLLVVIILVLDLSISSYYINSVLYSYQVMDILWTSQQEPSLMLQIFVSFTEYTTKNFAYPSTCLWDRMDNLQKMAYSYVIPGWMLIFMSFLFLIANKFPQLYHGTLMRRCLNTFTIIGLMIFSDFTRISFWLLDGVRIDGEDYVYIYADEPYLGYKHKPYVIAASLVIIIFIIGFPLLFVLSLLTNLQRRWPFLCFLSRITETFGTGLKTNYKCLFVFYLISRVVIFSIGLFTQSNPIQFVVLSFVCLLVCILFTLMRPYRKQSTNIVETVILSILVLISVSGLGIETIYSEKHIKGLKTLVDVLGYLPITIMLLAILFEVIKIVYHRRNRRKLIGGSCAAEVPHRILEKSLNEFQSSYQEYED